MLGKLRIIAVVSLFLVMSLGVVRAQEPVVVTFWEFSTDDASLEAWNTAIAEFEAMHPDIKVNMEIVPWAEQQQRLVTALTTGGLPDVSMLGNNVVAQYQALGALVPLTDYFQAWSDEVGRDITEDIWPGDYGYYLLDGDWWGSPVAAETRVLWYRSDLLEAAGFDAPPDTWAELADVARAVTTEDVYGFAFAGGIGYDTLQVFMSVYLGYGARFLNDEGMCGFDSQEFRDALTFYTNLYLEDNVSSPDTPTISENSAIRQLFTDGRAAMIITGPWLLPELLAASPDWLDSVKTAYVPAGPEGRFGFLGGWPLVMWAETEHPDETWEWMRYATDPEGGLAQIAATASLTPGKLPLTEQWLASYEPPWDAQMQTVVDQLGFAYPYQYPDPEIPQMATLEVDAIQTAVQDVLLGKSVDQATVELCGRINDVLSR
jgi:ABC-type glycerol-3-phosphate transport system substrate-binding protein